MLTKHFWHGFLGHRGGIEPDILIVRRSDDKRWCRYRFSVSFRNIVTLTNVRLLQDLHMRHNVNGARNARHQIGRRVRHRIGAFGLCLALNHAAVRKAAR
jgi:hypothetical protein